MIKKENSDSGLKNVEKRDGYYEATGTLEALSFSQEWINNIEIGSDVVIPLWKLRGYDNLSKGLQPSIVKCIGRTARREPFYMNFDTGEYGLDAAEKMESHLSAYDYFSYSINGETYLYRPLDITLSEGNNHVTEAEWSTNVIDARYCSQPCQKPQFCEQQHAARCTETAKTAVSRC